MKLYYFDPNNYGPQFFVMARSKEAAIAAVQAEIDKTRKNEDEAEKESVAKYGPPNPKSYPTGEYTMRHSSFMQRELDDFVAGKGEGTIDEYGEGEVIQSEVC